MKSQSRISRLLFGAIATILATTTAFAGPAKKPLKIFILAGQSNMEGHAKASTFDAMALDPLTAPLLKEMRSPRATDKVWISYLFGNDIADSSVIKNGKLAIGYGAQNEPTKIGPEFTFGITMQRLTNEPVLIIKTAWGGKSLHTDFRPPSAGPYLMNQFQLDKYAKQGKDVEAIKAEKAAAPGDCHAAQQVNAARQVPYGQWSGKIPLLLSRTS